MSRSKAFKRVLSFTIHTAIRFIEMSVAYGHTTLYVQRYATKVSIMIAWNSFKTWINTNFWNMQVFLWKTAWILFVMTIKSMYGSTNIQPYLQLKEMFAWWNLECSPEQTITSSMRTGVTVQMPVYSKVAMTSLILSHMIWFKNHKM